MIHYYDYAPQRVGLYKRNTTGQIKLDMTRQYFHGNCLLTAYALLRAYNDTSRSREWVAKVKVPRDMPKEDMREMLKNLAALAAMHLGEDYVIRHMTPIKGESK